MAGRPYPPALVQAYQRNPGRVVGRSEIAELLDVPAKTVHTWGQRGKMPRALPYLVSDLPAWTVKAIYDWWPTSDGRSKKSEA